MPEDHPVQLRFRTMLQEITESGGQTKVHDFGPFTFGEHIPAGPNITVFRYNPDRLRAIDALEEILHWEQIKEGGAWWRDYSNHPLYQTYQNKTLIMEDLAKRGLLNRSDLTPLIRDELIRDLRRVNADNYGYSPNLCRWMETDFGIEKLIQPPR